MDIDKSLDLARISRRNDSYFSLSSWRIAFSFLFLFSIFKIFRQKIFIFSQFGRFFKSILFLFSIFKIVKTKFAFYPRFMRFCSLFLFLFLWEMLHILERNMHFFRVWVVVEICHVVRFCQMFWCQKRTIANQNLNPSFKCKTFGKISLYPLKNY